MVILVEEKEELLKKFAGQAMQGMMSDSRTIKAIEETADIGGVDMPVIIAEASIEVAKELIKQLEAEE